MKSQNKIVYIDLLRIFASLSVVFIHVSSLVSTKKIKSQLAIICNILRFLGKEFLDGSLIQKRSAQNSQHFVGTPVQLEVMLNDSHHAICSDGRIYLDSDSSLSCAPEGLDFKMLLDPFKEIM